MRQILRIAPVLILGGIALSLSSCGGGGSGGMSVTPPYGAFNMAVTDGPSDNFKHAWVTLRAIALHTDPDHDWSPNDNSWVKVSLPTPITFDLAQLSNGKLNQIVQNLTLPTGDYGQIRLFLDGPDDPLDASASAIQSASGALQWNDQVEYADAAGALHEAALEVEDDGKGLRLHGMFSVRAGTPLNLAVDFNLQDDIVPVDEDDTTAFILKPNLQYFDMANTGAIGGQVDTSSLCREEDDDHVGSCAFNVEVQAELIAPDGTRHFAARTTAINGDSGHFLLYPLMATDNTGKPLSYDVVIRGRRMATMIIRGVPTTNGATPTSGVTQVQSTPITVTPAPQEYQAQFSSLLQPLTGGSAVFQETLAGAGEVPYEIRWAGTDPFTGFFKYPVWLENAPVQFATYGSSGALAFAPVTPQEGVGSYAVATNEAAYYTLSHPVTIASSISPLVTTFAPPVPILATGVVNGTVSGTLAVANSGHFDHGMLVITRYGDVIDSIDVSSLLAAGGGPITFNLPAGSASTPQMGAYYLAYLRVWRGGEHHRAKFISIPSVIDLRTTSTVSNFTASIQAD